MRAITLAILAASVAFATDASEDSAKKRDATAKQTKVWAAITVSTPVRDLDVAGEERFDVSFGLVNDTDKALDPGIESSRFLVNGKELREWAGIVRRGLRDGRWNALPPGDSLIFGKDLGKYFEEPGIYRLSWKGMTFEAPEIVFRVLPRKMK